MHGRLANGEEITIANVFGIDSGYRGTSIVKNMTAQTLKRYGSRIGPKLKELMTHFYNEGRHTDVREELALIRSVHMQRTQLFDTVLETQFPNTPEGVEQKRQATELAGQIAKASAEDVISICEKVAKIDALAAAQQSPYAVESVKQQITQFIYRIFDCPTISDEAFAALSPEEQAEYTRKKNQIDTFERAMDEELELPTLVSKGTTITPDMQVKAMDDTIPYCEPEETVAAPQVSLVVNI